MKSKVTYASEDLNDSEFFEIVNDLKEQGYTVNAVKVRGKNIKPSVIDGPPIAIPSGQYEHPITKESLVTFHLSLLKTGDTYSNGGDTYCVVYEYSVRGLFLTPAYQAMVSIKI